MNKEMILSVGMPRAGSGWYYNLTQDLLLAAGGVNAKKVRQKYHLERLLTEVNCNIGTLSFYRLLPVVYPLLHEPSYVIKLHAGRRPLADILIKLKIIKPTFIYRDPRDALLSAYEYGQRMMDAGLTNAFTHIKTLEDAVHFINPYIMIARGWISSRQTLVVRYEDLILDYDQEVNRLCGVVGINPETDAVQTIINKYHPGIQPQDQTGTHFVKGKIGRYKSALSESQLDLCDQLFGDFLNDFGYQK